MASEYRAMSMRSGSQAALGQLPGTSSGRSDSATVSTGRGSKQHSDEESTTSKGTTLTGSAQSNRAHGGDMTDFFSTEVFQIVLSNPTTAHRLLRFCQSRACGENMEFLQKVAEYNRLLDEMVKVLGSIHSTYTSPNAPSQINISHALTRQVDADLKKASVETIPSLEKIFGGTQEHIEKLLAHDIYPRFVKHQVTASATMALADHREKYAGLGDCFCMTDPKIADNPILFASDGFVEVTGYSRKDIIPRNCRFLQGKLTDRIPVKRLRNSIEQMEETVELLLNYRKNGEPFWNLLYCAPLFNEQGEVSFFLGGQINCSTTLHNCADIIRVLSVNDDELDKADDEAKVRTPSLRSRGPSMKTKSAYFKSWKKYNVNPNARKIHVRDEAGMEGELLHRAGRMNLKMQVEAFYTAYSKYLVMVWSPSAQTLNVRFFSTGIIDMLCLNLPNGGIAPVQNKDIFKVLAEHTASTSSTAAKSLKNTVRESLKMGMAVSVEIGLLTGFAEKKGGGWFGGTERGGLRRVEERYVTHWTPLKDEEGRVGWVVLTIAPKF